ncbi:TetR/AcrR family transcriptional regulator [Kutzneria albida]|uniref:TetR family transcription regulator n=1 Tax=Kutzneria albida DSM 43870 TaxID=1449976 RepID=W5W0J8_9PSEU|nr:TetR/AcrR family transcriptional regulator [Kutzneria albida]AHH94683.1 TetR family transcription regulator [Kutzneria albida DSM 43870]
MNASRTARDRARAELTAEIKDQARKQLAVSGADGLSLRAVAREMGMVSSALYRYFPSKDDLLTGLILDAYDGLGAEAEAADAGVDPVDVRGRWRAICRAVRGWALAHPHEYALIYGSPVPGYQAPQDTVPAASRVAIALLEVLKTAWAAKLIRLDYDGRELSPQLLAQTKALAEAVAPTLPPVLMARAITAWTQLFGMISFELFGQLVGSVDPSEEFFEHSVETMAQFVGLRSPR